MTFIYKDFIFSYGKDKIKGEFILKFLKSKSFLLIISLFFIFNILAFFAVSYALPKSISIQMGESETSYIPKSVSWLVTSRQEDVSPAMQNTSKSISHTQNTGEYKAKIYLYGIVPVKTVSVAIEDDIYVVPGGECIGINLKTRGVLAVGTASFKSGGTKLSPSAEAGIRAGDIIIEINGESISKASEMMDIISSTKSEIIISGQRDDRQMEWIVRPATDDDDGKKKIGLWIRESVAGIGTVTFYRDKEFASLGHPISDIDTGFDVICAGGSVCKANIIGIDKGEKGEPGSLRGVFSGKSTGKISTNSYCGVFGNIESIPDTQKLKIASKNDVRPGKAQIRCDIGKGVESFDIEIVRITSKGESTKSMVIRITDEKLISKTGGIVQGMSGSPILQNSRIVGAVTHVFVNDPTRGYGIFIENMLNEAQKLK